MANWSSDKARWWIVLRNHNTTNARIETLRAEDKANAVAMGYVLAKDTSHRFVEVFDHEPVDDEITALGLWR